MTEISASPRWTEAPALLRGIIGGIVASSFGTLPWAWLIAVNLRHASSVPWSVPLMAGYLWLYWQYFVRGRGWPRSTADYRRTAARASKVPDTLWAPALGVGALGLAGVLALQALLSRLVRLPQQHDLDPTKYPLATVVLWVVMGSFVAGIVEETAFRGYLQRPIERRHGVVIAILITGLLFAFAHFSHPEVGVSLLPFYLAVAAVYGIMAYCTDSSYPSMLLHTGGNLLGALQLFSTGQSEWQAAPAAPHLIWETGADAGFWASVILLAVLAGAFGWAAAALAAISRRSRVPPN